MGTLGVETKAEYNLKAPTFPKMTKSKTLELGEESRVDTKMCTLAVKGGGNKKKESNQSS